MTKTLSYLTILAATAALTPLAGCSKPDPLKVAGKRLVGTWAGKPDASASQKGPNILDLEGEMVFKFQPDGTFSVELPIPIPIQGTWQVARADGDSLTVKTVEEHQSISFSSETDEKGRQVEKEETTTKKEDGEYDILFKSDDQIVMTRKDEPDEPITFHRKRDEPAK
jgi:hypothetical protein